MLRLTVASKRVNASAVGIGFQMAECHKLRKPLPTLVENSQHDNESTKRIKRMITQMTRFQNNERMNIQEADQEFAGKYCSLNIY